MSFTFVEDETFEWPVEIHVPKVGAFDTVTIMGLFVIIDDTEFLAANTEVETISQEIDHQINQLARVFKGWLPGEVVTPSKEPWAPTDKNIRKFLQKRPNRMAVHEAYMAAITPHKGYRSGN